MAKTAGLLPGDVETGVATGRCCVEVRALAAGVRLIRVGVTMPISAVGAIIVVAIETASLEKPTDDVLNPNTLLVATSIVVRDTLSDTDVTVIVEVTGKTDVISKRLLDMRILVVSTGITIVVVVTLDCRYGNDDSKLEVVDVDDGDDVPVVGVCVKETGREIVE